MLHFESDYLEGAHPLIMQKLQETNMEKTAGYGTDPYCESARKKICQVCRAPQAEVHFLVGGTQTNAVAIKSLLKPWEGVLSAETGHISVHEAGAVEAGGHKVISLPHDLGKIRLEALVSWLETFYGDENKDHMVWPGMVYISHPTEYGALYTRKELERLHEICGRYHLRLYMDGARMGYGLAAEKTDVTLEIIAQNCDAFYIGGTKVGTLFGEALVFPRPLVPHFFTIVKQEGALLAKGRLLGIQFDTLFTDQLYLRISRHAIDMANLLKEKLSQKGCRFYYASPTNQQFLILENRKLEKLREQAGFSFWERMDDQHTIVRLATSWATRREDVEKLAELL